MEPDWKVSEGLGLLEAFLYFGKSGTGTPRESASFFRVEGYGSVRPFR